MSILIAYFSHTGENYAVGDIKVGNTAKAVKVLEELLAEHGVAYETHEIAPAALYPRNYNECIAVAKDELHANARPKIAQDFAPEGFDEIILAFPNWWGEAPMCVYTWLGAHNIAGKPLKIVVTHEGSGVGGADSKIAKFSGAKLIKSVAIYGHVAQNDAAKTKTALKSLF